MKTLYDVSIALEAARKNRPVALKKLVETTGLTAVTIRGLLLGTKDSRLSTLLAVANELGLEVLLVPKEVAASISTSPVGVKSDVETLVGASLDRRRQ